MILAMLIGLAGLQTTPKTELSRRPVPVENPGNWISDDDYPPAALRWSESGSVGFGLTIGPRGDVIDCKITTPVSPALDQATCALLLSRARFTPALDALGRPMTAQWHSRINWKIPPDEPIPLGNWHSIAVVKFGADGLAISCVQEKYGIVKERPSGQCDAFKLGGPDPFRTVEATGKPYTIVAEYAFVFPDQPGPAPDFRYSKSGHRMMRLVETRFEVSETGRPEKCGQIPTDPERRPSTSTLCTAPENRFIPVRGPDGAPRRVIGTEWFAISILGE